VEQYGADDNQTENKVLDSRGDGQQSEAVTQYLDDQDAEHGAEHRALAAHERCTADDAGCDRVGIVRLDRVNAVADTGTADRNDTSQSGHEAGQRVAERQHVCGVDTGQAGSLRVAAAAVDRAAQRGAGQQDVHDDVDNDNNNECYREVADGSGAQPHNAVNTGEGNHLGAGDDQACAPEYVLHTEGGNEGVGQVQAGQQ